MFLQVRVKYFDLRDFFASFGFQAIDLFLNVVSLLCGIVDEVGDDEGGQHREDGPADPPQRVRDALGKHTSKGLHQRISWLESVLINLKRSTFLKFL